VDRLLNDVLDPSKVSEVRQRIKGELEVFLDFQDQVTDIVEEVPFGPDHTILRVKKDLQSNYVLNESDNSSRTINVEGVLLKSFTNVISTNHIVSDLIVGATSAV
jgi:hypothetical protein